MQNYSRLTSERLAQLPPGSILKFAGQLVHLTGRGCIPGPDGKDETVIEYVDAQGNAGSFAEFVFLQSATEHLNSERCAGCNALRDASDCEKRIATSYTGRRSLWFCKDKKCADVYFASHPHRARARRRLS